MKTIEVGWSKTVYESVNQTDHQHATELIVPELVAKNLLPSKGCKGNELYSELLTLDAT